MFLLQIFLVYKNHTSDIHVKIRKKYTDKENKKNNQNKDENEYSEITNLFELPENEKSKRKRQNSAKDKFNIIYKKIYEMKKKVSLME